LHGASLVDTQLQGADLRGAFFTKARCLDAGFRRAGLQDAPSVAHLGPPLLERVGYPLARRPRPVEALGDGAVNPCGKQPQRPEPDTVWL
jgi:hypothetical protein